MQNDMENFEYLVRLLKKRNFDHQFIWGVVFSADSDKLLGELASFIEEFDIYDEEPIEEWIEENIGWDEFMDKNEDIKDDTKNVELLDIMDERKFHPQFCVAATELAYENSLLENLRNFIIDNDLTDERIVDEWLDKHIEYDEFTEEDEVCLDDDIDYTDQLIAVLKERNFDVRFCNVSLALAHQCGQEEKLYKFIVDNDIRDKEIVSSWLYENIDYNKLYNQLLNETYDDNYIKILRSLFSLLKNRNFNELFIFSIFMSTGSEELLTELEQYIKEYDIYEENVIGQWCDKNIPVDYSIFMMR